MSAASVTIAAVHLITINFLTVKGPNAFNDRGSRRAYYDAASFIESNTGIKLKPRFKTIRDPCARYHDPFKEAFGKLICLELYKAKAKLPKADITVFNVPPFKTYQYWLLGLRQASCFHGGVAFATGEYFNTAGANRYWHSVYTLAHEELGLIGARDLNTGYNIMNEGLLALYNGTVPVLEEQSLESINNCISKWR